MPTIKIDAATLERSGIETAKVTATPYRAQIRAYGMVLDLARLTDSEQQLHERGSATAYGAGQARSLQARFRSRQEAL